MNRNEFMEQLAYLLQDVADGERAEALQYYEDYFEDAGPEEEARVIDTLGSPEKVAAIIKNGLNENEEEEGEYTERGYQDDRFSEFNKVPEPRMDFKQQEGKYDYYQKEDHGYQYGQSQTRGDDYYQQESPKMQPPARKQGRNWLVWILAAIGFVTIGIPLIGGLAGGVFGLFGGFIGLLCGLVFGLAGVTIGGAVAALSLIGVGIAQLFSSVPLGILFIGIGCLAGAVTMALASLNVLVYGRLLPWVIRSAVGLIRSIFHRGGKKA